MDHLSLATELRDIARRADRLADVFEAAAANPPYRPTHPVVDGVELVTFRYACCGAGTDRRNDDGRRAHLPGCPAAASEGIDACRRALNGRPS